MKRSEVQVLLGPRMNAKANVQWGLSSVGRAPALQAGGQGFDPPSLHPARETLQKWRVFPLTFISLMPMPTSSRVRFGDMQNHEDGFIAEYDSGVCTACGFPIQAGQRIATSWGGRVTRYHHVLPCPGSAPIVCSICGGNWWKCSCP